MKALTDRALSHLEPASRCSALFAALSRKDMTEANRLADTAPHTHYVASNFAHLFNGALSLATMAALHIECAHKKYCAALALGLIAAFRWREGDLDLIHEADRQRDRHQAYMQTVWASYACAIQEAGLDPEDVMRAAWRFDEAAYEIFKTEHAQTDGEPLDLYRTALRL